MSKVEWEGREVEAIDFDIATGEGIIDAAMRGEQKTAMYLTAIAGTRYVDDGKPVFASLEELRALPFRLLQRVRQLSALAAGKNGLTEKPDETTGPLDEAGAIVASPARPGASQNGR
jgi:hypothetical protein